MHNKNNAFLKIMFTFLNSLMQKIKQTAEVNTFKYIMQTQLKRDTFENVFEN